MRYYKIDIADAQTGQALLPSSLGGLPISSLLANGQTNQSALNVEFDLPISANHVPTGNPLVRIWGLSVKDLSGAFNLNPNPQASKPGALITVSGGMAAGLPLANPAQAGILAQGQVLQAYGNWIGVEQTVDFILAPASQGSDKLPVNYTIDWKAGTQLADAIKATLTTALPNAKQIIRISQRLTLSSDQPGYYASLTQFSQFVNGISKQIISDTGYLGVYIFYNGTTVTVTDWITTPTTDVLQIAFTDLIGQPTWIAPFVISVKTVMRGDINLGDQVSLPPSLVTSSSSAFQSLTGNNPANNLGFSGTYSVQSVHHYGNFRQPDAASWSTVYEMVKQPTTS